jgi:hypothetical protein
MANNFNVIRLTKRPLKQGLAESAIGASMRAIRLSPQGAPGESLIPIF